MRPLATYRWEDVDTFAILTPRFDHGPYGKNSKQITCAVITNSRAHLSARPFRLFSVSLLIFGSHFCVAISDSAGTALSPAQHLWDDLDMLVRIVWRLTHELGPVDLGQDVDPTARELNEHSVSASQAGNIGSYEEHPGVPHPFPVYEASMGQGDRRWHTRGRPIRSSLSEYLPARASELWHVLDPDSGKVVALKNRLEERCP
ncbi:hypothetical protein HWV62_5730 [Athelia sp. TMB]|nr:hypothetical protein HWV62_37049 [Athelia sp. TMB]KAF7976748.1 hypothetical protein HWV62_5730 [Athelia sp. TMB]